ncbi:MAG: DnaJ C-terminal domain-containing protein [Cyanobacteria bacterium P01_E01_bin.6]
MSATDFKDYYAVLQVNKAASADEIKRAYRKLARKLHPDMNPGDAVAEARFKEVNEAYEVLSDAEKRRKYDQFGKYWKQAGGATSSWPGNSGGADFGQYDSFDEFINELLGRFGGNTPGGFGNVPGYRANRRGRSPGAGPEFEDFAGFGTPPPSAGQDIESPIKLSYSEAFHGVQQRLSLGSEIIDVRIPPGAKPGSRIRLRGKGQMNPYNRQRGDLYLIVELVNHPVFTFDSDTLFCEIPVAPDEAVLGGSIDVPTPDGSVSMNIPAGIRSGQTLRLRGKGWPNPKGGRGDQLVRIVITPPKTLSKLERDYYEKLSAQRSYNPRQHLQNTRL